MKFFCIWLTLSIALMCVCNSSQKEDNIKPKGKGGKGCCRKMPKLEETIQTQGEQITAANKRQDTMMKIITELETGLRELSSTTGGLSHSGSVYVRWGRKTCPGNGTELVYNGYAGGSHYAHAGGATNALCLPSDPDYAKYDDKLDTYRAFVYGAEYQLYSNANWFSGELHDDDVPCAVCRSPRASVVMVPAKNQCHGGWNLEYAGYLMAGRYNHASATEYICVDGAPEAIHGGTVNNDGKLFYITEGRCGSLKCPPYVNGRELTCAVCSK